MNLMYFKTMRGDRESGFSSSSSKPYRSGGLGSESCDIGTSGFGSSWGGGVGQKWFSQGVTLGSTASQPAQRGTAVIPMEDLVPSPQHHLRTHLLLDLSGNEDQGSGGSRSNSSESKHSGGKWIQGKDPRPDIKYQRIRGDPNSDPAMAGSRSVRSGLYDTEVCLSVGGLGNLKGTVMQNNGAMCPRTGKQVTFGQRSPPKEEPIRMRSQEPSLPRRRDGSSRSREPEKGKTSTLPRTRSSSRQPDSRSRDDSDANYGRRKKDKGDSDLSSIDDVNLSNMQGRDCFIIPVNNVRRFMPAGVGLPRDRAGEVQVLEMADPQLVVLLHFMSPLLAIQPVFESPLSRPAVIQKNLAQELLAEVLKDRPGAHGMLLVSIEHNAEYPYINYGVANRQLTIAEEFQQAARFAALEKFNPSTLQYFSEHLVDSYEECATIARPPIHPASRRPVASTTGYIVSVYKVFDGDDGERFERNWLYWTVKQTNNKKKKKIYDWKGLIQVCSRPWFLGLASVVFLSMSNITLLLRVHSTRSPSEYAEIQNQTCSNPPKLVQRRTGRWDSKRQFLIYDGIFTGDGFWASSKKNSACLATLSTPDRLYWLPQVVSHWGGIVSLAVFMKESEDALFKSYFRYLRHCHAQILANVTVHLLKPGSSHYTINLREYVEDTEQDRMLCSNPSTVMKALLRSRGRAMVNKAVPQNHLRNVARKNCPTSFVFTTDIDIIPSHGASQALLPFLESPAVKKCDQCAYVIPTFELDDHLSFPKSKAELLSFEVRGRARPFHEKVFIHNQHATNFSRWRASGNSSEVLISHPVTEFEFSTSLFIFPRIRLPLMTSDSWVMALQETRSWILYDAPSYNMYSDLPAGYFWGEDYCVDLPSDLTKKVSSLRYAGSPFGYKVDGIHLYGGPWFGGTEIFLTGEARVTFLVKSLIVTGKSTWTLYENKDYTGFHVCVTPSDSTNGHPGFYTKESDYGFGGRRIESIRKGCFT